MINASESLEDFIKRRMAELDSEVVRLHAAILELENERKKLEAAFDAATSFIAPKISYVGDFRTGDQTSQLRRPRAVAAEKTIKQAVVEILKEHGRGMTALEILPEVNARLGIDYPRTSLSPQLSRLKADRVLERHGTIWRLATTPLTPLLIGGQTEAKGENTLEGKAFKDVFD